MKKQAYFRVKHTFEAYPSINVMKKRKNGLDFATVSCLQIYSKKLQFSLTTSSLKFDLFYGAVFSFTKNTRQA